VAALSHEDVVRRSFEQQTRLFSGPDALVGPVSYGATATVGPFPIDAILTDASDRAAATAMLDRELSGGSPTGFDPVADDGRSLVSFAITVVHAEVTG
jgi:hypothetical protein